MKNFSILIIFDTSMYRKRRILEWREQTVVYMERYEFEPNPKDSKLLDTRIQTVNAPILVIIINFFFQIYF